MQNIDKVLFTYNNYKGYNGECPQTEEEYNNLISSQSVFSGTTPTWSEIQTKVNNLPDTAALKTSAKQKLMNGEALTEDEANVMVGL
jgi:hypothetical protein